MQTQVVLTAPDINYAFQTASISYANASVKANNIAVLNKIKSNYGAYLSKYESIFEIPPALTASFIATESSGRNTGPNKFKATGLMQITPGAFYDVLNRRLKTNDIAPAQLLFIKMNVPGINIGTSSILSTLDSIESKLLQAFEKNSEFNIYAGMLYLDFLIDRFAINGKSQINKALVAYNAGPYRQILTKNIAIALDSTNLSKNILVPKESRGYLVKILGVDGYLDLILNQQKVTF